MDQGFSIMAMETNDLCVHAADKVQVVTSLFSKYIDIILLASYYCVIRVSIIPI